MVDQNRCCNRDVERILVAEDRYPDSPVTQGKHRLGQTERLVAEHEGDSRIRIKVELVVWDCAAGRFCADNGGPF